LSGYRYLLWRDFSGSAAAPICAFIGLNPSTADAVHDDPTTRRCIGYARRWGYGALALVNLFAYRSVRPAGLRVARDPVGRYNDAVIDAVAASARLIVCAWGNHGAYRGRSACVAARLRGAGHRLHMLGGSCAGEPLHPLYLPGDLAPVEFADASATVPPEFSRAARGRGATAA
jgi:hypothetical protein